jgi:hypothetical protein
MFDLITSYLNQYGRQGKWWSELRSMGKPYSAIRPLWAAHAVTHARRLESTPAKWLGATSARWIGRPNSTWSLSTRGLERISARQLRSSAESKWLVTTCATERLAATSAALWLVLTYAPGRLSTTSTTGRRGHAATNQ